MENVSAFTLYPPSIPAYFYPTIPRFTRRTFSGMAGICEKLEGIWVFVGLLHFQHHVSVQILGAGQGFIADRFTYIAYYGMFLVLAIL